MLSSIVRNSFKCATSKTIHSIPITRCIGYNNNNYT